MGRRTVLSLVAALAITMPLVPEASADICMGSPTFCEGHGDGRPGRGGGGSPGGALGSLSINNDTVTEGDTLPDSEAFRKLVFTVTLTGGGAATVQFATQDGTASSTGNGFCKTETTDYQSKNGTLSFTGPGQRKVRVTVNNDFCFEDTENMFVNLSSPEGATIADGKGRGNIQDDDQQQKP